MCAAPQFFGAPGYDLHEIGLEDVVGVYCDLDHAIREADGQRGSRFQHALSLDIPSVAADGIVGPITWRALVSGMLAG